MSSEVYLPLNRKFVTEGGGRSSDALVERTYASWKGSTGDERAWERTREAMQCRDTKVQCGLVPAILSLPRVS